MDTLIIVLVLAVGVGVFVLRERINSGPRRRREGALREVAAKIGFTYERDQNPFGQQPPLDSGLAKVLPQLEKAFYGYPHLLRGNSASGPTCIFDVWYDGGKNSASSPYKLTLFAFHLANCRFPEFSIYPEGRRQKVGDKLFAFYTETIGRGWRDIDFADHSVFSDRYSLHGRDEAGTRALFQTELITFLEALPIEERWAAAGAGNSLVLYRFPPWTAGREQEVRPEDIETFLAKAGPIAAAFSGHGH